MTLSNQRELVILRRREVQARTGLSRSTIYQYMKAGIFPRSVPLGPRAVGWLESEVSAWIAGRVVVARDSCQRSTTE
jgi:prophage regulatory protein